MIIKEYNLYNKKIKEKIKINIFSDLHISTTFKYKRLDKILTILEDNKPDYICIPGDIVDTTNILENKEKRKLIILFFKN